MRLVNSLFWLWFFCALACWWGMVAGEPEEMEET